MGDQWAILEKLSEDRKKKEAAAKEDASQILGKILKEEEANLANDGIQAEDNDKKEDDKKKKRKGKEGEGEAGEDEEGKARRRKVKVDDDKKKERDRMKKGRTRLDLPTVKAGPLPLTFFLHLPLIIPW